MYNNFHIYQNKKIACQKISVLSTANSYTLMFIKFQIAKLIPKLLRCWHNWRFLLGEETGVPGENPQRQRGTANPAHVLPRPGIEPRSHW